MDKVVFTQFNSDWVKKYIPLAIALAVAINVLVLDVTVFSGSQPTISQAQPVSCPQSCTDIISSTMVSLESTNSVINATSSSLSTPTKSPTPTSSSAPTLIPTYSPTPTPSPTFTPTPTPTPIPKVKEFFIPLGSGFESSADWKAINGIGASINLANYGEIDKINFEVTIRIPNGNQIVYVRLYNATSYQSVDNSELTLSSGTPTLLISNPISLSAGNNTYQIQMKTQLGFQTFVDQARIRILTK